MEDRQAGFSLAATVIHKKKTQWGLDFRMSSRLFFMFAWKLVIAIQLELVKDLSLFDDFFFKNKDITSLLSILGNKGPFSFFKLRKIKGVPSFFQFD